MSGPSDDRSPIHREDLVAYLDGELDAQAARRIEERLRTDESLRHELHRLQQAWDLLASLPRTEALPTLAKSTVEMLAVEAAGDLARQSGLRARRQGLSWGAAAAMLFIAGLLAVVAADRIWPDPDAPLLRELPVLLHFDPYQQADNIDFLRELRARELFVNDTAPNGELSRSADPSRSTEP